MRLQCWSKEMHYESKASDRSQRFQLKVWSESATMLFSDRMSATEKTSITVMWRVSFAEVMKESKREERRVAWHTLFSISWHPWLIVLGNVSIRHLLFSLFLFISLSGSFARKTPTTTPYRSESVNRKNDFWRLMRQLENIIFVTLKSDRWKLATRRT